MMLPQASHAKLMIIVHPEVLVQKMARVKIKQIYLNRSKKWQDGSRIHLTILEGTKTTRLFLEQYIGKSPAQFNRYWKSQLFSGKGIPPEYFKTISELLQYIKTTKGAIGIIDSNEVPVGVSVITLLD
jgi:ABC-type phosphate transport system substrate-binding protein